MFIIVLTGGLGAGKSTAAQYLRSRGASVIDLDDVAARVLTPGSRLLVEVATAFGDDVLADDGSLERAALAQRAFADMASVRRLNAIVHPAVAREVGPALAELRLLPHQPEVVVLEVPLLAEAPVYAELGDLTISITAPEPVRVARAVAAGMSEDDARRRIAVQATDEERSALSDVALDNSGDRDSLIAALERLWDERVAPQGS